MTIKWQVNSASDLSGAWSDVSSVQIDAGSTLTLGILESGGAARTACLWAAAYVNESPASATNSHGAELASEGWVEVSAHGAETWEAIKFPASFPAAFSDLGAVDGVFQFTISASARTLLDFRLVVPAGASSEGVVTFSPVLRCVNA